MQRHANVVLLAVLPLAAAMPAAGQVTYLTQSRFVGASAGLAPGFPDPYAVTISAPGFGPFSESVEHEAVLPDPSIPGLVYDNRGFASQASVLAPDRVEWSGMAEGTDEYPFAGSGHGMGTSILDVTFSVSDVTPYAIEGTFATTFSFGYTSHVVLERVSDGTFLVQLGFLNGPVTAAGVLDPGQYRLRLGVTQGGIGSGTGSWSCSYDVVANLPGPSSAVMIAGLGAPLLRRRRR